MLRPLPDRGFHSSLHAPGARSSAGPSVSRVTRVIHGDERMRIKPSHDADLITLPTRADHRIVFPIVRIGNLVSLDLGALGAYDIRLFTNGYQRTPTTRTSTRNHFPKITL